MPKNVVGAIREYSRTCVNRLIAKKAVGKHQLTSLTLAKRHTLGYMQVFCDKPSDFTAMLHKTTHLWKALWRPSRTLWLCIARAYLRNKTLACAQTKKHSGVCDAQCYQRQAPREEDLLLCRGSSSSFHDLAAPNGFFQLGSFRMLTLDCPLMQAIGSRVLEPLQGPLNFAVMTTPLYSWDKKHHSLMLAPE